MSYRTLALPLIGFILLSAQPAAAAEVPPSAAVAAHEQVSCRKCHLGTAAREGKVPNSSCVSCHRRIPASPFLAAMGGNPHGAQDQSCTACHTFHEPGEVRTSAGALDIAGARQAAPGACASCHGPGTDRSRLNPAHMQAAMLYHQKSADLAGASASAGCLNCHDRSSASAWKATTEEAPLTFQTHASHPIGMKVVPGSGPPGNRMRSDLDPRIPLFDGRMECQSCHLITASTEDLLLPFASPKELCLGCHQLKPNRLDANPITGPVAALD